jgi:hypothetical protein
LKTLDPESVKIVNNYDLRPFYDMGNGDFFLYSMKTREIFFYNHESISIIIKKDNRYPTFKEFLDYLRKIN